MSVLRPLRPRTILWCSLALPLAVLAGPAGCGGEPDEPRPSPTFREGIVVHTVDAIADSVITTAGPYDNTNYGDRTMTAMASDDDERLLVRFSPQQIADVAEGELVSATLRVHLFAASGFAPNHPVHLHRLIQDWEELAVTHNCSVDADTTNDVADCTGPTAWDMSGGPATPWVAEIATTDVTDGDVVLEFDVTADVASILDGVLDHKGWAMALEENATGLLRISMREGGNPPQLELTFDTSVVDPQWTPPDPEAVAPEPDLTVIEPTADRMTFLYEGPDPVQIDVAPETIEDARVGVIRGQVRACNGIALEDVEVRVVDHPELGMTKTRGDGRFDLAANGGSSYVLELSRDGLLDVRRRVDLPWNDFANLGEITMVGPDPNVTVIDLTSPEAIQIADSSPIIDDRGTRQAIVMFRAGTVATMHAEGQPDQELPQISVRATEYTVGGSGPDTMPGPLPRSSGYTYAAEFSIDEAEAAGASSVSFTPSAISYVENFTQFPVGMDVPAGVWDETRNAWVPELDGRIIEVVGLDMLDPTLAAIDVDGDGVADSEPELAALGIDASEREALANRYSAGTELWRVETPHFSAWDYNWGVKPPEDAVPPTEEAPKPDYPVEDSCEQSGSIIECENQVLGEVIPLAGTDLSLHYRSGRVFGGPGYRLEVPLLGNSWPASLNGVKVWAEVAGQRLEATYGDSDFVAGLSHEFVWDGKDAYGKSVQGHAPVDVCVSWLYPMEYTTISSMSSSKFGYDGNGMVVGVLPQAERTSLTRCFGRVAVGTGGANEAISAPRKLLIGGFDAFAASDALGGWTLSNHHTYSPEAGILYRGDGSQREVGEGIPMIETFAGNGTNAGPHTGVDRLDAQLETVDSIAVDVDGDVYIGYDGRIVRVEATDGLVVPVAGTGSTGFSGDGGLAITAEISVPAALDFGPDGTLYFIDQSNHRIRAIFPDGTIDTVAGNGTWVTDIDDLPEVDPITHENLIATDVPLGSLSPKDLTIGPEGSIYYLGKIGGSNYVRRILPSGTVRPFVGYPSSNGWLTDPPGFLAPGWGFATPSFRLNDYAFRLEANETGEITVATWDEIVRLGGAAQSVSVSTNTNTGAQALALTPEGTPVWSSTTDDAIYTIEDGAWTLLAGGGNDEISSGIPAVNADFTYAPVDLAFGPDGTLYVAYKNWVRRIYMDGPGRVTAGDDIEVPSEDGGEVYVFDSEGRHLETRNSVTGVVLWTFGYDAGGRLVSVTDRDGDTTTITRDVDGDALSIDSSGVVTSLQVTNGELQQVVDAAGNTHDFGYTGAGLLDWMEDPRDFLHDFDYDGDGRLVHDAFPNGGSKSLARTELEHGHRVDLTTAMGVTDSYIYERSEDDATAAHRVHVRPSGAQTEMFRLVDGSSTYAYPDGRTREVHVTPDERFGMSAPLSALEVHTLPSGLVLQQYRTAYTDGNDWVELQDDEMSFTDPLEIRFDPDLLRTTVTSPEGRVGTIDHDALGRVIGYQLPNEYPVTMTRDSHGRVVEVTQGEGSALRKRTFGHDGGGFVDLIVDYFGLISQSLGLERNAVGWVLSMTLPDLNQVIIERDAEGRMTTVTPPGGIAHQLTYNEMGSLASYDPPDVFMGVDSTEFNHDLDDRLIGITRPGGTTIDITYVPNTNRIAMVTASDGAQLVPTFDAADRLTSIDGPWMGSSLSYTYDGNVALSETWSGTVDGTVSRTLGADGRTATQSVNGGYTTAHSYDGDGLPIGVGLASIARDAATGRVTAVDVGSVSQTLAYDGFGGVEGSTYVYGPTTLYDYALTRDEAGRIVTKQETVDGLPTVTWAYQYDDRERLSHVDRNGVFYADYVYDDNGNRLSVTTDQGTVQATFDDQDRIMSMGDLDFTHADDGTLEQKVDTLTLDTWSYDYDAFSHLTAVDLPDGTQISYEYDARGRPIARRIDGAFDRGWLWRNELDPIAEVDEWGNVTARFVYGRRGNVPEYMIDVDGGNEVYRLVADDLGSVRMVVNVNTGAVAQTLEYDPWGRVVQDTNPGFQPFGFGGGLYDPHFGAVRFGFRWYDPDLGRWMRKDPLRFEAGDTNLYQYVFSNPVNLIDENGLTVWRCKRVADLPVARTLKLKHHWLKTDTKEVGLGECGGGIPGQGEARVTYPVDSCLVDHTGEHMQANVECEYLDDVDEDCVNEWLDIGAYHGWWVPLFNDCQTFADEVIADCDDKPAGEFVTPMSPTCQSYSCMIFQAFAVAAWNY